MKYVILVLLLLTFGCTEQAAETGNVNDTVPSNGTSDAVDMPADNSTDGTGTSSDSTEGTGPADSGAVSGSGTSETASNPDWGTECEYRSQCGSFGEMRNCVMGHCVDIECSFRSDCKEKDHCFRGKCYLEDELLAEFPECGVNVGCNTTCTGCKSGQRRCLITGWQEGEESKEWYICTECSSDYDCSEGYKCVQNYCVKGPN